MVVCIIMIGFTFYNLPQIESHDSYPDYYMVEKPYLQICSLTKLPHLDYTDPDTGNHYSETARNTAKWWFDCLGYKAFGGYDNVLPFLFSLGIIGLTYLLASSLTTYKLVGVVASFFLTINSLFYNWSTTVTYDQSWAFFLILSVYLIYRNKLTIFSIPSYILSILAKALSVAYLPMFIYTVLKSKHDTDAKLGIIIVMTLVAIAGGAIEYSTVGLGAGIAFHPENSIMGLQRAIGIILWNLPVLFGFIGIEFMFRRYAPTIKGKAVCFSWMIGIWVVSVLTYIFSGQFSFPYRFVPFAVFMSIYIGIVCTRVIQSFEVIAKKREARKNMVSKA